MAKKKTASRSSRKTSGGSRKGARKTARKSTAKRTRVSNRAGTFYAKRKTSGRFKEMDEQGRSQKVDRRKKAKTKTKSGYGDQGDRRSRGGSKKR